ncbi:MAG: hypothetical protein AB7F31_00660 [Parachlamydiales bacterium]
MHPVSNAHLFHAQPLEYSRQCPLQITLVINGIFNKEDDVKQSAEHLAKTFNLSRKATWYFHINNDLTKIDFSKLTEGGFFSYMGRVMGVGLSETAQPDPERLADDLVMFFQSGIKVDIHCHSQGSLVTRRALERLQPQERQAITVTTYGAISLIPYDLASKVRNIVNLSDSTAELGQRLLAYTYPQDDSIQQTKRARHWVEHASLCPQGVDQVLTSYHPFSASPALLEMCGIHLILPTIRVQNWTTKEDPTGHTFCQYITESALPPGPATHRYGHVFATGLFTWVMICIALAQQDQG